jgi:isopentenyl-diphosphate delta-isomerase
MPKQTPRRTTASRKKQHVDLTLGRDVGFRTKTNGLHSWEFVHNALPELNLADINTSTQFLGKTLAIPFMISCMTGGYAEALTINRQLAEVCEETGLAMGVGSERQALEDTRYHRTFSIAREAAPSIPIVGNLGAAEVARLTDSRAAQRLVDLVRADAFAIHLNALQEFLQPEGTPEFRGVLNGIALLARELPVPVIVKEIGAGLSADVVRRLLNCGVTIIDVAGAGGTSWAGVEILRAQSTNPPSSLFWDWGIPTATAVREAAALKADFPSFTLIASGGLASGIEMAKCMALGADLTASARPILKALHHGGKKELRKLLDGWIHDFRGAMFLTGSSTIAELQQAPIVESGNV